MTAQDRNRHAEPIQTIPPALRPAEQNRGPLMNLTPSHRAVAIVDAHAHLIDPGRLRYRWGKREPQHLRRLFARQFFETAGPQVVKCLLVEAAADVDHIAEEIVFAAEQAGLDPRVAGFVAAIDVTRPEMLDCAIARLADNPLVVGTRLLSRYHDDPRFFLAPEFLRPLSRLSGAGLSCDIGVWPSGLDDVRELALQCPETRFALNHAGKPMIADSRFDQWASDLERLSACANVVCKISGLATLAGDSPSARGEICRYIRHAYEVFGSSRTMFGSDWPMVGSVMGYQDWIDLVATSLGDAGVKDMTPIFGGNATRFYRLT
jgi:L-fuconolactonase